MVTPRVLRSPEDLLLGGSLVALLGVLLFLACNRDSTEAQIVGPAEASGEEVGRGPLSPASLTLPFQGTNTQNAAAFSIKQEGQHFAGIFQNVNTSSTFGGLLASSFGSGPGISVSNFGTGRAATFGKQGNGDVVYALTTGGGRAGVFLIQNSSSQNFALEANTNGGAHAIFGVSTGTGGGALFQIARTNNTQPAVQAITNGTGPALQVDHNGSSGNLALFRVHGNTQIRFTRTGKGIFDGGTQTGGADVAEAMAVEGRASAYEPGDVLVISTRSDRTVEKAAEPYSTRVIGVYATKPGVLLTERGVDESLEDLVPVGVVGVIPTKVSAENGPIRRGDLLVSARTPGHAMRADSDRLRFGMVLGKALGEFMGPGQALIPVLVNVK